MNSSCPPALLLLDEEFCGVGPLPTLGLCSLLASFYRAIFRDPDLNITRVPSSRPGDWDYCARSPDVSLGLVAASTDLDPEWTLAGPRRILIPSLFYSTHFQPTQRLENPESFLHHLLLYQTLANFHPLKLPVWIVFAATQTLLLLFKHQFPSGSLLFNLLFQLNIWLTLAVYYNAYLKAILKESQKPSPFNTYSDFVSLLQDERIFIGIYSRASYLIRLINLIGESVDISGNKTFISVERGMPLCREIEQNPGLIIIDFRDRVISQCDMSCLREVPVSDLFGHLINDTEFYVKTAELRYRESVRTDWMERDWREEYAAELVSFVRTGEEAELRLTFAYYHRCGQVLTQDQLIAKATQPAAAAHVILIIGLILASTLCLIEIYRHHRHHSHPPPPFALFRHMPYLSTVSAFTL